MHGEIKKIWDELMERKRLIDKRAKTKAKRTVKHKRKRPVKSSLLSRQPHLPFHLKGIRSEVFSKAVSDKRYKPLSDVHRYRIGRSLRATWEVVSPDGKKQTVSNLKKYCAQMDINYKCLLDTNRGRLKQTKGGWYCRRIDSLLSEHSL